MKRNYSDDNRMDYMQTATQSTEGRLENLIQPGRETQRHLCGTIADLSLEVCGGCLQWF